MPAKAGALISARAASAPQPGQGCGSRYAAIGFDALKLPQSGHEYSYKGIGFSDFV